MARIAVVLLLSICLMGCGNGLHSVKGKVVFPDGSPLTEGRVVFQGIETERPPSADGEIQPDGTFELGTLQPRDGVRPGRYRAAVVLPFLDPKVKRRVVIDRKFADFSTSGLEFTVKEEANEVVVKVK